MLNLKRLAVVALLAGAAVPASGQDASWDAVVAAAKQEGKVVVYNMALGAPYFQAVIKSFATTYGIPVESLDLRASELVERIRTEQSAGRYLGDAEMVTTTMIEEQLKNGDFIQKLPPIPNAANLRPPFKTTDFSVPAYVQPMGILINTRLVRGDDVPTSWNDLNAPKWKGKLLSDDMRPLGSGNTLFAILQKSMGADFNEKLAEQKPVFSRDMRNDARRVARGEYPIYISQVFAFASDLKGLPVKVVVPKEGAPYAQMDMAMLKGAPHPNAARLFMQHFLSVDSQALYANAWMLPVVQGAAERADPDAQPYANAKLIGPAKLSERADMMALAKKLYP
ncbi:ABC transporter substrate-binding protein [Bradyrhizobium erythrophlei]|uniref:Iron(III) transport system substrate-binding protein n=1 Tax=Bradyrhizobium erythrophlei TaxID=1437360 RepID=A0A1M5W7G6_9BRAD|nr:extracellular solute-binding protein [Bradyrhizobium erythrophlei]SHH83420.1 iron(III) transport system substrate-binding protein [Bradyrhizobium erythrophlei]